MCQIESGKAECCRRSVSSVPLPLFMSVPRGPIVNPLEGVNGPERERVGRRCVIVVAYVLTSLCNVISSHVCETGP